MIQLNIHEAKLIGEKYNLYGSRYAQESQVDLLKPLLDLPGVYEISQTRGFSNTVKKQCCRLKNE